MVETHLEIIARLPFRVAKTMPEIPHEYTVRGVGGSEEDWRALLQAIKSDGVPEKWNGRRNLYLHPGDGWKYWSFPPYPIINRQLIENDVGRLRREGQPIRDANGKVIAAEVL